MEFDAHWRALLKSWRASLSDAEGEDYDRLNEDLQREALRRVRVFADRAKGTDLPLSVESLGERLGVPWQKGSYIRGRFVDLGIIKLTTPAVPNVTSARFRRICGQGRQSAGNPDWSVP